MPTKSLLLLTLLALLGISFAQSCTPNSNLYSITNAQIKGLFQDGIGLAALALTISFDVVAIGYIIGKLIPATGVLSWIRNEYWEIAKSAMLIASIYAIITIFSSFAAPFASTSAGASPLATLVDGAQNYLCAATITVGNNLDYLSGMSVGTGIWKSANIGTYLGIPIVPADFAFVFGFTFNPYSNSILESSFLKLSPWESLLNTLITVIVLVVSLITIFQEILFTTIITLGLAILIPIGLIMRAFPFIRGVGGTLIAIGIGAALIYPATLTLFNAPISNVIQNGFDWPTPSPPPASANPPFVTLYSDVVNGVVGAFVAPANPSPTMLQVKNGYNAGIASFASIYPGLNGIVNTSIYSILQFILFIADLMIVFPLVDSIAKMLGGTINLQLGGKLKLA